MDALITCRSVINSTQVGQHRLSLPCLNWGVPGCLIACSDTRGLPGTIPGGWCCGWKWWFWNSETMQSCRGENQLPGGERVSWAVQESRVHISRSLSGEVPGSPGTCSQNVGVICALIILSYFSFRSVLVSPGSMSSRAGLLGPSRRRGALS